MDLNYMNNHFKDLSKSLDNKNDKHERIYKTNRDVTVKSKRIIFALQRIPGLSEEEKISILSRAANDLKDIEQTLLKYIAMELRDGDAFQFIHAYTGGLQEYIEAASFYHYISTGTIITHEVIQEKLIFAKPEDKNSDMVPLSVLVPPKEYILGLADLTGELMRFCIKSISTGDFETCYNISGILKQMKAGFLSLGHIYTKELSNKVTVFNNSLLKVEEACYSLQMRKCELPPHMLADAVCASMDEIDQPQVSLFS